MHTAQTEIDRAHAALHAANRAVIEARRRYYTALAEPGPISPETFAAQETLREAFHDAKVAHQALKDARGGM